MLDLPLTCHGTLGGAEASIGVHWASLSPEPTNFDIGLGVFGGTLSNSRLPDDASGNPESLDYGGLYGEFGKTLSGGDFWRTWALGRAEYLQSEGRLDAAGGTQRHTGIGVSAKLDPTTEPITPQGIKAIFEEIAKGSSSREKME